MVLYICAQIDIMTKRLNMLPELRKDGVPEGIVNHHQESAIIKDCVHYHIYIYSWVLRPALYATPKKNFNKIKRSCLVIARGITSLSWLN